MKYKNFYLFILCICIFLHTFSCETLIKSISFIPNTNIFTNETIQRDGIILAKLNTNEDTTLCNYNFNEISAGIICKTLGFPAQGLSIINNAQINLTGPVLLANIQCTGLELNISFCVNSGRSVQPPPCSNHVMDVHVYCLQKQVPPVVTPNDVDTVCNKTNPGYIFVTQPNKQNVGLLWVVVKGENFTVCNDDYSFYVSIITVVCNKLCSNIKNVMAVMPYPNLNITNLRSVKPSCLIGTCQSSDVTTCFKSSYIAGIKCGDEPQFIESAPNVTCSNQNMTVFWPKFFTPFIDTSLISLVTPCDSMMKENILGDADMFIPFNNCTPTIISSNKFINFTYAIKREYSPNEFQLPKTLTVSCSFPRNDSSNNSFIFKGITDIPVNSTASLNIGINFYSESGYNSEVVPGGEISNDKDLFVKVYVKNPIKNISLILTNCYASTVKDFVNLYTNNSVSLITDVCPNTSYNVVISPYSTTEVRFQFSPYKTLSTESVPLYVLCKTSLCYLNKDENCPTCNSSSRKKRSVDPNRQEYEVIGSVFLK